MTEWKRAVNGVVGPDAVVGGTDNLTSDESENYYVGRALVNGHLKPGRIYKNRFVFNAREPIVEFEYLVKPSFGMLVWKPASYGRVPTGAVIGGRSSGGEPLFIGRAEHESQIVIGTVQPSRYVLNFPWKTGVAYGHKYEVLCLIYD